MFTPNRENDELTRALGNPEHPGRTRGKGVIPWYEGFSEWNEDYRTRARRKMEEEKKRKLEEEQRKQDAERLQGLEVRHADLALKFQQQQQQQIDSLSQERGSQQRQQEADDRPALDSTVPSMPRSNIGSAPGDTLLDTYTTRKNLIHRILVVAWVKKSTLVLSSSSAPAETALQLTS